ncbi:FAD-binding and (Fe-S)-binding domain-containing protein [Desulfovermiculus halophilus]|jgi:FAD/FMN-containing dehydrogenase/Fe-S oxidoreductase|uniref:FAD-binding and (Fe-S)-binding domain-containing protein n=1 Tax=Desulfovermiculus halophilus TaxID=339722 RepID=UPI000480AB93|nr:FAD-binding and (Fe-S)-binding domain-containing protein [Desulfovermiculus halophilus]
MHNKTPHISVPGQTILNRVLSIPAEEFRSWSESTQELATSLSFEFFIVRYNPFIPAESVAKSVFKRLEAEKGGIAPGEYAQIKNGLESFWEEYQNDQQFKSQVKQRLAQIMPSEHIVTAPNALVECATDATDLRLEIPMLLVAPGSTEEVQRIIALANEMEFSIVPRGGGSGLTGGAIPAARRTIILSLSRMKSILSIDTYDMVLCAQTGVITLNAIEAVAEHGLLFTVDPASKASSSLGGNISENAGGPFAFEYGTTLDNILSYTMVQPSGQSITVTRRNHPRHKILPRETAVFDVTDHQGNLLRTVSLEGGDIRAPGLGKDVSNKVLGGLPGIQKEGVDGIITEACFTLYPKPEHSQTLCLEFFGQSMHNAMRVITELVQLRDRIREQGDLVKMSSLEEFGTKYVQAIEYEKKSQKYEGEPISVLLIQIDSGDLQALEQIKQDIVAIAEKVDNVDVFVARDEKEAEEFWHDRHRLSAITKHTSGFKINEDVVIPIQAIPEFADFIEELNLHYLARAYRKALQQVSELDQVDPGDEFIDMEMTFANKVLKRKISSKKLAEQEFELQIHYFFQDLISRHPQHAQDLEDIHRHMSSTRIIIANHMHAGDGNCHVNLPVNSNDQEMLRLAEEAAGKVFRKVLELSGSVSGEHGIGITKIAFLDQKKIQDLFAYKQQVDPKNLLNPGKLVQSGIQQIPYTFSFNRLIQDIAKTSLPHKDKLIELLRTIQTCSRCGKCKQVCPMYYPERGFLYHPRNKIITLGALIEALYYSLLDKGQPDKHIMESLEDILERCTACGKCTAICPVKINVPDQVLSMRSFLEEDFWTGQHPIKTRVMKYLSRNPERVPAAAKVSSIGQSVQKQTIARLPRSWRERRTNILFREPAPSLDFTNLYQVLQPGEPPILWPRGHRPGAPVSGVYYFPGCGASLFSKEIGLAAINLLLSLGTAVIIPPRQQCCGYPLLASGSHQEYRATQNAADEGIGRAISLAQEHRIQLRAVVTSCGTCRESLLRTRTMSRKNADPKLLDILQYVDQRYGARIEEQVKAGRSAQEEDRDVSRHPLLLHSSCHSEWSGLPANTSSQVYALALSRMLDQPVKLSPGCCGESGLGALTSPHIYNTIRDRKKAQLALDIQDYPLQLPVVVSCPSCKIGIRRILLDLQPKREVIHALEYINRVVYGREWAKKIQNELKSGEFNSA